MNPSHRLGFLVASPRSGTTWLQTALSAHPDIVCIERRLFGMHADVVADAGASQPRVRITLDRYVAALNMHLAPQIQDVGGVRGDASLLGTLADAIADHAANASGADLLIDKVTPYVGTSPLVVRQIRSLWPQAPIAHLVRDGRDVAVSGVMHWLTKTRRDGAESEQHGLRRRHLLDGDRSIPIPRLFLPGELAEWAATWRGPTDALRTEAGGSQVHTIRYEAMLEDMTGNLSRLLDWFGAEVTPEALRRCAAASSFERMSGGRHRGEDRPGTHVRKGVAGDWRRWFTREDGEEFETLAGDLLADLGYETDRDWWRTLPDSRAESVSTPSPSAARGC